MWPIDLTFLALNALFTFYAAAAKGFLEQKIKEVSKLN